ncbi:MAG: phosphoenolpyruvate carboxylase, partial [Patescibacteria group bacterium]
TGSLPFRGGVNPWNIAETIHEYQGIRTMTLQSAFRYDYPKEDVVKAMNLIRKKLPILKPRMLTDEEVKKVIKITEIFEKEYKKTIEELAPLVNEMAKNIPGRR